MRLLVSAVGTGPDDEPVGQVYLVPGTVEDFLFPREDVSVPVNFHVEVPHELRVDGVMSM